MRATTKLTVLALSLLGAGCAGDPVAPADGIAAGMAAPVFEAADARAAIADEWIVVLEPDARPVARTAASLLASSGGRVGRSFEGALRGFTATLTGAELERLRQDPAVAYIEQDARVHASGIVQLPWNLERIGLASLPAGMDLPATGAGVTAYVIDTGIRATHAEFDGRASHGFDAIDGGAADDCNGHGTHVAGTIGGETYGVARAVSLVAVRVLDCGGVGSLSDVIAGIDWVAAHHVKPAVANLSIVGGASRSVDEAVQRAIDAGVVFVVAAGNDGRDACDYSPARAADAITVGATTRTDAAWALSNQGACVDIFAPGVDIVSAGHERDDAAATLSGTSMAAPHVAGAAAIRLELEPDATPADVAAALRVSGARGRVARRADDSPDVLLQVRIVPTWRDLREWAK